MEDDGGIKLETEDGGDDEVVGSEAIGNEEDDDVELDKD